MSKLYLEAIRALPPEWIRDDTQVVAVGKDNVMAACPDFAPMVYERGRASWEKMVFFTPPEAPAVINYIHRGVNPCPAPENQSIDDIAKTMRVALDDLGLQSISIITSENSKSQPIEGATARQRMWARYERDKCDDMTEEQWGKWLDELPHDEFMAMIG